MRETWEFRAWMEGSCSVARLVYDGRCFLPQGETLFVNITNGTTLPCANSTQHQLAKERKMHDTSNAFDASSSHVRVARQPTPCGPSCGLKRDQSFGSHPSEPQVRKKQHDGLGCKRAMESCLPIRLPRKKFKRGLSADFLVSLSCGPTLHRGRVLLE